MNLRNSALFILFLFVWSNNTIAQQENIMGLNNYLQRNRIGLVDEFFERFNGEKTHPYISSSLKDSRKKNLMMLFNLGLFQSETDPYMEEASEMMDYVIANDIKIHYPDTAWVALAHCVGLLEGKTVKFDITLKVQHRKEDMYKWVLSKVEGNFFDISAKNQNDLIMFYPDDHETFFMSIGRMTEEQPHNVERFLGKDVKYDMTSVFAYLVYNKKLIVKYVEDLEFVFFQIPGYIFHLKYFDRDKTNAGWLISKFYKTKCDYLLQKPEAKWIENNMYNNDTLRPRKKEQKVVGDSLSRIQSKKLKFNYRLYEHLSQLKDYISYIQQYDSLNLKSLYIKEKLENLFSPKATVKVKKKSDGECMDLSLSQFTEMLYDRTITIHSIDSICIPVWDDIINSLDESVTVCELPSCVKCIKSSKLSDSIVEKSCNQTLTAYKVLTEEGDEWIPKFGNLIVTIIN